MDMQAVDGYIAMEALNEVLLEVTVTLPVSFTYVLSYTLKLLAIDVHM